MWSRASFEAACLVIMVYLSVRPSARFKSAASVFMLSLSSRCSRSIASSRALATCSCRLMAATCLGVSSVGSLFSTVAIAFIPTQLPLGVLEGFLSAGAVLFLFRRRPDILVRLAVVRA